MTTKTERWYAIRTKPGTQRMAPKMPATREEAERRVARLRKREVPEGETIIERDCRDRGFEIFMPSYWIETKHHRTKQWLDKRFPLLSGYAFVNLPGQDFERLRCEVDSVVCVLKMGRYHQPFEFTEWAVGALRLAEWEAEQNFRLEKAKRIRSEEIASEHLSRREIKELFPKGRRVKISQQSKFGAGLEARVLGPSSQGTVKTIIEALDNALTVDIPVEFLMHCA